MTYQQLLERNKTALKVRLIKSINDTTLSTTFHFNTNLHCDFGIQKEFMNSGSTTRKSAANKRIQQYQNAKGKKFKLAGTDNSLGYTRLIYELT